MIMNAPLKKCLLLAIVFPCFLFAQKEGNIWCFGQGIQLNFNSGAPVESGLSYGAYEGCASICDTSGNLLFYTDGIQAFNKLHQGMGAKLDGHESTTQTFIVPKPNAPSIYFILTIDAEMGPKGFRYSTVDMSLNNGLGGISEANVLLNNGGVFEKIAVIRHCNGVNYWIIIRGYINFYVYEVSELGINSKPVITKIGYQASSYDAIGYMKASHSNTKIAVSYNSRLIELIDFDNANGKLSNAIQLKNFPTNFATYGLEFSRNDRFLYAGNSRPNVSQASLYQFDLQAGNATDIDNSRFEVATISPGIGNDREWAAIQEGPDKKIYVSRLRSTYLSVINSPDLPKASCNFVEGAVSLNGKLTYFGLPVFIHPYVYKEDCTIAHSINFPNIFTPNNDGINDIFRPIEDVDVIETELLIYNRWGNLIYKTTNIKNGWDGMSHEEGVYYWRVQFSDVNNERNSQSGFVHLLR